MSPRVVPSRGAGRPKEPIETRSKRTKRPHLNRKGEPDQPMEMIQDAELPRKPPIGFTEYEKECWNMIRETQVGQKNSRWIYRADGAYLIATCKFYGRWKEVHEELNKIRDLNLGFLDADTMKVNPLIQTEMNLLSKYQQSLIVLGLVPGRRQVVMAKDDADEEEDSLIKH